MTSKPDRSLPALFTKARTAAGKNGARVLHSLRRGVSRQPRALVRLSYRGRMGNRLFQYCLARRLARDLGFTLRAEPVAGFPRTAWTGTETPRTWGFRCPRQVLKGHTVDLDRVLADPSPREIYLWGYFERYAYYQGHKEAIREWLACPVRVAPPNPGDVVLHVRSGDIWAAHNPLRPSPIHPAMPVSYYRDILAAMKPERVLVVTENPEDPVARRLQEAYGAVIVGGTAMEDFALMLASRRVILSMSTFAWWAAWLSQATEVHMPLWGGWHPQSRHRGTDLRVTDESRYVLHDLGTRDDWRGDAGDMERTLDA